MFPSSQQKTLETSSPVPDQIKVGTASQDQSEAAAAASEITVVEFEHDNEILAIFALSAEPILPKQARILELLEKGANPNLTIHKEPLLWWSIRFSLFEVIKYLMEKGAKFVLDNGDATILQPIFGCQNASVRQYMFSCILQREPSFLAHKFNESLHVNNEFSAKDTYLILPLAIQKKCYEIALDFLLSVPEAGKKFAKQNLDMFVSLLFRYELDLNAQRLIDELVKQIPEFVNMHYEFVPLLSYFISRGDTDIVQYLLSKKANVKALAFGDKTNLHILIEALAESTAAGQKLPEYLLKNFLAIAESLIKAGVPIDAQDGKKNTALHIAAYAGLLPFVKLLVENGANVSVENSAKLKAIDATYWKCNERNLNQSQLEEIRKILIAKGSKARIASMKNRNSLIPFSVRNYPLTKILSMADQIEVKERLKRIVDLKNYKTPSTDLILSHCQAGTLFYNQCQTSEMPDSVQGLLAKLLKCNMAINSYLKEIGSLFLEMISLRERASTLLGRIKKGETVILDSVHWLEKAFVQKIAFYLKRQEEVLQLSEEMVSLRKKITFELKAGENYTRVQYLVVEQYPPIKALYDTLREEVKAVRKWVGESCDLLTRLPSLPACDKAIDELREKCEQIEDTQNVLQELVSYIHDKTGDFDQEDRCFQQIQGISKWLEANVKGALELLTALQEKVAKLIAEVKEETPFYGRKKKRTKSHPASVLFASADRRNIASSHEEVSVQPTLSM